MVNKMYIWYLLQTILQTIASFMQKVYIVCNIAYYEHGDSILHAMYSPGQKFCCMSGQKWQLLITQLLIS